MRSTERASAVILAGGRSRRLGQPKPFVEIGGRTVLERLLEATAALDDVMVSVRDPAPFAALLERTGWTADAAAHPCAEGARSFTSGSRAVRLLPDPVPDQGPVAGLAGGLTAARETHAIVLSGDLPFVSPALVTKLLTLLRETPGVDAVVPHVEGRDQPLCAAYRRRVGAGAADYLAAPEAESGGRSVTGLLERLLVRRAEAAELGDPEDVRRAIRGIDTPEDLDWARRASR